MTLRYKLISALSIFFLLALLLPPGANNITTVSAGGYCDWASFVADVTIPDGVPVVPGYVFKKTWRLKNIGTCTWTTSYKLVFVSGTQMGSVSALNIPKETAPGQTIDLTISLTAPTAPGKYSGYWALQNPASGIFGIGQTANKPFWVTINVVSKAAPIYSFIAQAPNATWVTEASGKLTFPGFYGDPRGFVMVYDRPILENGIPANGSGILMGPPAEYNEHVYGKFPPRVVKRGDRFQAVASCEYGSKGCNVTFVLQYQVDGTGTRSFWNLRKELKNTPTVVDLNISSLEGKNVTFILLVRPNGTSTLDRALWVNPVITNVNDPAPVIPTVTPIPVTAVPTISTLPPGTSNCNRATFVTDVTVPDGTVFTPGQSFTKTWRIRNNGTCTWTTDYSMVFSTGDQLGGTTPVKLTSTVAPGQTIDLSQNLVAPNTAGSYRGYWLLSNASGTLFGIGPTANKAFWLAINVSNTLPPSSANGYDFVANVCNAQWSSGVGAIPCPSSSATNGSITVVNNPLLENNTVDSRPALLAIPHNAFNGYVQGIFPPFAVQSGDRFKSILNCEFGHTGCYVVYRLDYQIDNGPIQNFWSRGERYEGQYAQADVDLSALAGQNVKFILRVDANGAPTGDRAMWVAPAIVRSGGAVPTVPASTATSTPVPTAGPGSTFTPTPAASPILPTATSTPLSPATATSAPPATTGKSTYINQKYGFQFIYPNTGVITSSSENFAHMILPIFPGTNLVEKYLDVTVFENVPTCTSPLTQGYAPGGFSSETVIINGVQFVKESGQEAGAGQIYDWVAYSTQKGNACTSMSFVLHSTNPSNYPSPPPFYNKTAESAVFTEIMSTFSWMLP
jgi:hypothetical protein